MIDSNGPNSISSKNSESHVQLPSRNIKAQMVTAKIKSLHKIVTLLFRKRNKFEFFFRHFSPLMDQASESYDNHITRVEYLMNFCYRCDIFLAHCQ